MSAAVYVVGIDPGTSCGWAVRYPDGAYCSGTWDLRARRHEGGGMRFLRFTKYFAELLDGLRYGDGIIVGYEEVRRHMGVDAAHVYGGIIGALSARCEELQIPYSGYPVGTVKKLATGKGNASKDAMVEAAVDKWPGYEWSGYDEVDARWIAETAHAAVVAP